VTEIRNGIDLDQYDCPKGTATWPISRIETISQGEIDFDRVKYVAPTALQIERYQLRYGDILFSHINSPEHIGKTALFAGQKPLIHGINLLLVRVDPNRCVPAYLNALLNSKGVRLHFRARCKKAVNQASLNREDILSLEIRLPSTADQQRIAAQLEQADRLRRARRYALELTDTFLPAAFLQLFGDPVPNPRSWPVSELEELATVERGKFTPRPRNDPSYYGGNFPFIQTGDISKCGGRLGSWTQTLNEKGVSVSRSFPPGTVVIAIVGATIGITAILEAEVYCPDSVVGIQVDSAKASKEYIEFLLRFWRPVFLAQAPETARANINLDILRPLRIPAPPLPLQQQFAALVERVERLRSIQRESLRQSEHLFQSLLHQAFSPRA